MGELYTVIMAGGSGTRFWPLSRKAWPKQFLALAGAQDGLNRAILLLSQKLGDLQPKPDAQAGA